MNKFKIALGLFLIYIAGGEYIVACRHFHSFFNLGIVVGVLLMLVLCTWFIGTGLSKEKFEFRSIKFLKYYIGSFLIFLICAYISLLSYVPKPEIVKLNGVEVNIGEFMDGMSRMIPDTHQRREYCICVVAKLTQDKELAEKNKDKFRSGKFSDVILSIQNDSLAYKLKLNECMTSVSMEWTPAFENGIRTNLMKQLKSLGLEKTNNIEKYCDCFVEEYKKIDTRELSSSTFYESTKNQMIDSICNLKSKLSVN